MISDAKPVWLAYIDKHNRIMYVNDTYLGWAGLTMEQVLGKTVPEVLGDGVAKRIAPYVKRVLDGEHVHFEERLIRRVEGERHVLVDYTPDFDVLGKVAGYFTLIVDVTDQKQAAHNSARLAAIVESSRDAIVCKDLHGNILTWNRGAEITFGYKADEVIGRNIGIICPENADDDPLRKQEALLQGEVMEPIETRRRTRDGRDIDVLLTLSPIRGENGDVTCISSIYHDITHLKRTEEALRYSEEMHRTIGETVPFGSWMADAEGKYLMVTKPFLETFNLTLEGVKGFGWLDRVPEEERPGLYSAWTQCVQTGDDWDYEYHLSDDTGKLYSLLTVGRPVRDEEGGIRYWVGFHLDNTEREAMEEDLKELNEQLESKIRERTQSLEKNTVRLRQLALELTQAEQRERQRLGQVLHDDLQQLLAAAKLRLERLMKRLQKDDNIQQLQEILGLIKSSSASARDLTIQLRPPILNKAGLQDSLKWLRDWVGHKFDLKVDLTFKNDIRQEELPQEVAAFLFEAMRELLFNVVKHAGVLQATILVKTDKHNCLHVIVGDKGRGFQGDPFESRNNASSGIGLLGIRDRLQLMGGNLIVETGADQGFTGMIAVPLPGGYSTCSPVSPGITATDGTPASAECSLQERRPIRILLVDDHSIARDGLKLLLQEEHDLQVVAEAEDGVSAVEMARKHAPDVVVMDINMPKLSGIEATRLIKAAMADVSVIGLSINKDQGNITAMLNAGASAYHTKTDPADELVKKSRRCVAGQSPVL